MNIQKWLEYNSNIQLSCPECDLLCYGEDCPTHCTECGCASGGGTISLDDFIRQVIKETRWECE